MTESEDRAPPDLFRDLILHRTADQPASEPNRTGRLLELTRLIFESAGLGVWVFDTSTGQLEWDRQLMDIYGVTPEEFDHRFSFFEKAVVPEDLDGVNEALDAFLQNDQSEPVEFRIVRPDGAVRWVQGWAVAERNSGGEVTSILGVTRDVTDERQVQQSLAQARKMHAIGKLTGGMAHDFNNLLAVILGNLELVQRDPHSVQSEGYVHDAVAAAVRGGDLTRSLLSFARQAPLMLEQLSLNQVVSDMTSMLTRTLPANISFETFLTDDLWTTTADRNLLESSLLNLVINARDAMSAGGRLTLETANVRLTDEDVASLPERLPPGNYAMIAVTDTGEGIEPDILDAVFEPFFTTKAKRDGSGLGLSMVQSFAHQSGGTIIIDSEVGVGTRVTLYFESDVSAHDSSGQSSALGRQPIATRILAD